MNVVERAWSWWSGQSWPIAIDVGAMSVRTLQLDSSGASLRVCAAGRYDLPSWTREQAEPPLPLLREAIETLLEAGDYRSPAAVVVLPETVVSCHALTLDVPPQAGTQQAIRAAAAAQLPATRYQVQHVLLSQAGTLGEDRRVHALLFAVEHAVVERVTATLGQLGLEAAAIEVGPVALARGLARFARRERDQQRTQLVIDAGHSGTRVAVLRGQALGAYERLPIGAATIDSEAAKTLAGRPAVDPRQLRTARLAHCHGGCGEAVEDLPREAFEAAEQPLAHLAEQIGSAVAGLLATHDLPRPGHLYVTGGGAYDRQLLDQLTAKLGIEAEPAEPLHGVDLADPALMIERRSTQPEWTVAMGAALRSPAPALEAGAA